VRIFLALLGLSIIISCTNDIKDVNNISTNRASLSEIARDVEILYSDSAVVKVRIKSPTLKRYTVKGETYDEFPDGLLVEFMDDNQRVKSWLEADYAVRKDREQKIYMESNVQLYNKNNDKLETEALVWDEGIKEIYTSRTVKISQPSRGDTSLGHGFKADQEFTRFEIKRKFSAIKNVDDLTKDLDK